MPWLEKESGLCLDIALAGRFYSMLIIAVRVLSWQNTKQQHTNIKNIYTISYALSVCVYTSVCVC